MLRADPSLVDAAISPSDFVSDAAVVYPDAVSEEEGRILLRDVQAKMKRRRYEKGHWDAVITDYKEVELPLPSDGSYPSLSPLSSDSDAILRRLRSHLSALHFGPAGVLDDDDRPKGDGTDTPLAWMPCHGIDLKKDGQLNAHVDSVRYSGGLVAGLSLMSPGIMRVRPAPPGEIARSAAGESDGEGRDISESQDAPSNDAGEEKKEEEKPYLEGHVDLYLPPLSLYVLSGVARYRYTHELLSSGTVFLGSSSSGEAEETTRVVVERERRISVIFRDAK